MNRFKVTHVPNCTISKYMPVKQFYGFHMYMNILTFEIQYTPN
jgi:hypothetical protein